MSRGILAGFCCLRACVTGVSCFPDSCHVRGERPGRSRTGRSPAAVGGAAGVLEVTGWEPDDWATGNGSRAMRGIRLFRSVPCPVSSGAGSAAGCSHPFACPRPWPGAHGAGPRQGGGQAGSIKRAPAPPGSAAGQTTRRPRAWPLARGGCSCGPLGRGSLAVSPGGSWTGSGSARRAGRRTLG